MHLDPSALSILHAIFGMALLTLIMAGWMSVARQIAMGRTGVRLQQAAHTRDLATLLPSSAQRVADNYNHLMEAPTVFYAVALAIIAGGIADPLYADCAWAFLFCRILHSLVQATFNRVSLRAGLYGLSWIALAIMIVRSVLRF
ncbi:MAG TPA: MAPEG family protein [Stellaceae bacterium]|nr:MAPEG family protein [Stellaceae bacterium]